MNKIINKSKNLQDSILAKTLKINKTNKYEKKLL